MSKSGQTKFAFSINEQKNSKEIIEKICEQSKYFFRYRPRDGKAIFEQIKDTYHIDDVDSVIDVDKMLDYSFELTKIEDLSIGGVRVKYGYNYATKNYDKVTDPINPQRLQEYKDYYGIDTEEDFEIEIEAQYIQDRGTAYELRDYIYLNNKHQHLICKFSLSTADGIEREIGDVIMFNDNPQNTKPYGRDIKNPYLHIDQTIYPYFFITKVSKTLFKTTIEAIQIHQIDPEPIAPTLLGDVTGDGQITIQDVVVLLDIVLTPINQRSQIFSLQQLANADVNQDTNIDVQDAIALINLIWEDLEYVDWCGTQHQSTSPQGLLDEFSDMGDSVTGMKKFEFSSSRIWFRLHSDLYCIPENHVFDLGDTDVYPHYIKDKPITLNVNFIGDVNSPHYDQWTMMAMVAFDGATFYVDDVSHPSSGDSKIYLKKSGAIDSYGHIINWSGSGFSTSQGVYNLSEITDTFASMFDVSVQVVENYWEL